MQRNEHYLKRYQVVENEMLDIDNKIQIIYGYLEGRYGLDKFKLFTRYNITSKEDAIRHHNQWIDRYNFLTDTLEDLGSKILNRRPPQ